MHPSAPPRGETPDEIRVAHVKSERAAREAGVVCFVAAAVFLLVALFCLLYPPGHMSAIAAIALAFLPLAVALGLFSIGRGLRRLESWARSAAIAAGIFLLMVFPVGTVFGALLLAMLLRANRYVFSSLYRDVIASTGGQLGKSAGKKA